jgi:hypothetical protein
VVVPLSTSTFQASISAEYISLERTMRDLTRVVEDFLHEAADDDVGLWRVVRVVRRDFGKVDEADVRAASLEVIKELLNRGVEIVDYYEGRGWAKWPEQTTNAVRDRIEREWTALGRDPNLGDICWFRLPRR